MEQRESDDVSDSSKKNASHSRTGSANIAYEYLADYSVINGKSLNTSDI